MVFIEKLEHHEVNGLKQVKSIVLFVDDNILQKNVMKIKLTLKVSLNLVLSLINLYWKER